MSEQSKLRHIQYKIDILKVIFKDITDEEIEKELKNISSLVNQEKRSRVESATHVNYNGNEGQVSKRTVS